MGKGLGIDYFHCMTCNACMSTQLKEHICREKGLESNCPICHDFLFTSNTPVKALPCGHFMHSACFQVSFHFSSSFVCFLLSTCVQAPWPASASLCVTKSSVYIVYSEPPVDTVKAHSFFRGRSVSYEAFRAQGLRCSW